MPVFFLLYFYAGSSIHSADAVEDDQLALAIAHSMEDQRKAFDIATNSNNEAIEVVRERALATIFFYRDLVLLPIHLLFITKTYPCVCVLTTLFL